MVNIKNKFVLVTLLLSMNVQSEQIDDYTKKLLEQSNVELINNDFQQALEKQRQSKVYIEAQQFGKSLLNKERDKFNKENKQSIDNSMLDNNIYYEILISDSMGDSQIQQLLESSLHNPRISFVISGFIPSEKTFGDVIKRIYLLTKGMNPAPYIKLDPRPFEKFNVNEVPYMYAMKNDNFLAGAYGITNTKWLKEKIDDGEVGDLGKWGNTVAISETSITEIIEQRIAKLDKDKIIKSAKDAYWTKKVYVELPMADKTITRKFKPEIYIPRDIKSVEGVVVAKAGTKINLLDVRPFTQKMVIFDATDQRQMDFVKSIKKDKYQKTTYITTKVKSEQKFDAVKNVETELGYSVYLLNSDLINSFNLKKIPSVVTANNKDKVFIINEYDVRTIN